SGGVLVDSAVVLSTMIGAGGTGVIVSGGSFVDGTVASAGLLEIHAGAKVSGLEIAGGAVLDFADADSTASATLSGSELDISVGSAVVAQVGLTSGADALLATAGPLTLVGDGHGGRELAVPGGDTVYSAAGAGLGNDTILPSTGVDTAAPVGSATVVGGA